MHKKALRKLEESIGKAILEVICDMGVKRLPLLSEETIHLMAKATVEVYEATVENDDRG